VRDARARGADTVVVWRRRRSRAALPADPALGADGERFAWEDPASGAALAARGAVAAVEAEGAGRFSAVARESRTLVERVHVLDETGEPGPRPLLVGGFAFAPDPAPTGAWREFPAARFVLPARLAVRDGSRGWDHVARRAGPDDAPDRLAAALLRAGDEGWPAAASPGPAPALACGDAGEAGYLRRVEAARRAIRSGRLQKVVVARALRVLAEDALAPDAVLTALRRRHAGCRVFAHAGCRVFGVGRGDVVFAGATPERLVRVEGRTLQAEALAGTAPRGRDPVEDAAYARALVESKKEQAEHAHVVRALRQALAPLCDELVVPEAPRVRRLSGIQHLATPLSGTLRDDLPLPLLAVAARVHPTPAVAGAPTAPALRWLERFERLDRGWYAGLVGWLGAEGDGELAVALRSVLLRGREAVLYAGAGIVEDSDPAAELRETDLKLRAALGALRGGDR